MNPVFPKEPCKDKVYGVSLGHGDMHLDNRIDTLATDANLRTIKTRNGCTATLIFSREAIKTRNGCTATLIFSREENPTIRKDVADMLLCSLKKRSEAS